MFDLGGGELLLIVLAVLVFFGPKKLPELAQSLGRGMREFKRAQREFTEQITQAVNDEGRKKTPRDLKRPEGSVARGSTPRPAIVDDEPHDFMNEISEEEFRAEQSRKNIPDAAQASSTPVIDASRNPSSDSTI